MFNRVLFACLLVILPGFLFFMWQFWLGHSLKVETLTRRAVRDFSNRVKEDVRRFERALEESERILRGYTSLGETQPTGLPLGTFDWESFSMEGCEGKITLPVFLGCFRYIHKAKDKERKLGAVYTWLRMIKDLSPGYYQVAFGGQVAETGIEMSPEIKGYHWLNIDSNQALFLYQYSADEKLGFSLLVNPVRLWEALNLAKILPRDKATIADYQSHPLFPSMRFVYEPDLESIRSRVSVQNYLILGVIGLSSLLLSLLIYYLLRRFLGELQILGTEAKNWSPGRKFSSGTSYGFKEVKNLRDHLVKRSEGVLAQSKKFQLLRRLQGLSAGDENLLSKFRETLKKPSWNPVQTANEELLKSGFHQRMRQVLQGGGESAFSTLVNEIYSYKYMVLQNFRKNQEIHSQESYLKIASKAQELLLITRTQRNLESLKWDVRFLPGQQVAGDFYLVSHQSPYTYFCVADVAGKGLQAGLFAARLKAVLDGLVERQLDLSTLFESCNAAACENKPEDSFCTCFMGRFNHRDYTLDFCSAGHNFMFLIRDGAVQNLSSKGLPLGMLKGMNYPVEHRKLSVSDRILLYSDGCVELENIAGELYGNLRFENLVLKNSEEPTGVVLDKLLGELEKFRSGTQQADDMTLLVVDV